MAAEPAFPGTRPVTGGLEIDLQVVPRSAKERVGPVHGERLKVHINAPPVDGAANEALRALLGRLLQVSRGQVELVRGETGRKKTVRVSGDAAVLSRRLWELCRPEGGAKALLLAGALVLCACGGNKGSWQLQVLTPPGDNVFQGATQVRISVGDQKQQVGPVNPNGSFSISVELEQPAQDQYVQVTLEALGPSGAVVARGRSPNVVLVTQNSQLTLFVARVGKLAHAAARLQNDDLQPGGRVGLVGVSLRGRRVDPVNERAVGALFAGGANSAGVLQRSAWVYDPLTHGLLKGGSLLTPRRGAVLVPSSDSTRGQQALLWGGSDAASVPVAKAELFDPAVASLDSVFTAPQAEVAEAPGASGAAVAEVQSGVFLACGGSDGTTAVPRAVLLQRFEPVMGTTDVRPGVRRGPDMRAPRSGHSATPVLKDAALVFGGTADDVAPTAELFTLNPPGFVDLALSGASNAELRRRDHMAAPLSDGRVLIIGGRGADDRPLAGGFLLDPTQKTAAPLPVESQLKTARYGASATVLGAEILLCGGRGADGPLADCEIYDLKGAPARIEPLPGPRAGHVALPLETGNLLLVGGEGKSGPVAEIEIYTPL